VLDPLRGDPRFEALVQKVFAAKQVGNFLTRMVRATRRKQPLKKSN
jgi:hypothetical protein